VLDSRFCGFFSLALLQETAVSKGTRLFGEVGAKKLPEVEGEAVFGETETVRGAAIGTENPSPQSWILKRGIYLVSL
jgi:hypothetical protein